MGTIRSPWRYDVAISSTQFPENPRVPWRDSYDLGGCEQPVFGETRTAAVITHFVVTAIARPVGNFPLPAYSGLPGRCANSPIRSTAAIRCRLSAR